MYEHEGISFFFFHKKTKSNKKEQHTKEREKYVYCLVDIHTVFLFLLRVNHGKRNLVHLSTDPCGI